MSKTKILTFELNSSKDCIDIHCDKQGAQELADLFLKLSRRDANDHEHLMTPDWGGDGLSMDRQDDNSTLLNKVTIHFWKITGA